jgi:hypothetical protein
VSGPDESDGPHSAAGTRNDGRQTALIALLAAGSTVAPSRAAMVSALADARRAVAIHRERELPLDGWLAGEFRFRGVRENAAAVAALETPEWRDHAAAVYRREHPDRAGTE